jgi:hypothetical protein
MAIGGFVSLAVIALLRQTVLPFFSKFVPRINLLSDFAIAGELSVMSISNLTILESTNLIISQSVIATVGGVLYGMARYVLIDQDNPQRKYLEQPWDELIDHVSRDDRITIVTCGGNKITGEFEQIANDPEDKDLLIRNPRIINGKSAGTSKLGKVSYHNQRDISRVIVYNQYLDGSRSWTNRQYMRLLQWFVDIEEAVSVSLMKAYLSIYSRPYPEQDDRSNIGESVQLGGDKTDDGEQQADDGEQQADDGEQQADDKAICSTLCDKISNILSKLPCFQNLEDEGGGSDGDQCRSDEGDEEKEGTKDEFGTE